MQSLLAQGEGELGAGFGNLAHHVRLMQSFGVPVVVAINRFPGDAPEELRAIQDECARLQADSSITEAFTRGGDGSIDLTEKIVAAIDQYPTPNLCPMYAVGDSFAEKLHKVATKVYGASGVTVSDAARAKLDRFSDWGFDRLPICIAKTQYSLTDDPKRMGAPKDWMLHINDTSLSAGAGFVVAVAGNMMLMPGLPREPRALAIDVDDEGTIVGV